MNDVEVERLSSYTSNDNSSYDDETDNNTILEAPSVMEQTVYDDGASGLTRKFTTTFDGSKILKKLSTSLAKKKTIILRNKEG